MELVAAGLLLIIQMPPWKAPADLPAVPWVTEGDTRWQDAAPLFELSDAESGTSAKGWAAVTSRYIRLRVNVRDDRHVNTRQGADIWDGDSLQVGVDARGDGSKGLPEETAMVGPDDGSITVALTNDGTKVWAHFQGRFGRSYLGDGARQYPCSVTRDEQAGMTVYDVAFPWEDFDTAAGAFPMLGLAVQVNDSDDGPQQRLYWGRGAGGQPRPGLFQRLVLSVPPEEVALVQPARSLLWRPEDRGEMIFAVASDRQLTIRAQMGEAKQEMRLPAARLADGIQRFAVQASPGVLPEEPIPLKAELVAEDGQVLATCTAMLDAPGRVVRRLHERAEELARNSPHPLFTRHVRSVDALVQQEWNRGMLIAETNDEVVRDCVRDAATILTGLESDAAQWDVYTQGRRSLILARSSAFDATVQYYSLRLPRGWDPERTYPLIVDLHGMGPSHVLGYVEMNFRAREVPQGQGAPKDEVEPHYRLAPWGRGNNGWREQAEDDLWEALSDAKRTFRIDEDRTYLTGHSMGGGGAWAIGLRTPDVWAAVCPCAGGTWWAPAALGLGRNASYLPVRVWHGEADGAVPVAEAYEMQGQLRRYGNEPDMVILPGQGHDCPWEHQLANARWLLQHRRKRPDRFVFMADTERHRGVWGIRMARSPAASALPQFECRIEGNTVYISSEGAPGLSVQLGKGGLGLEGDAVVYWNGREAYRGPAQEVSLGETRGRR